MIVIDASVAILGLLNDGDARHRLSVDAMAVPHLIDAEVAHVLRGQVSRGTIDEPQARKSLSRWARLGIQRFAVVGLLDRMWGLRDNLSGYDACYVALAESLGCELITADARLSRAPGPTCAITVIRG